MALRVDPGSSLRSLKKEFDSPQCHQACVAQLEDARDLGSRKCRFESDRRYEYLGTPMEEGMR